MRIRHAQHIKSNAFAWQSVQRMQPSQVERISVNVGRLARAVSLAPKYEYVAASDATTAWQGWGRGLPLPLSSYSLFFSIKKGMGKASFESSCFLDSGVPTSLESFVLVRSSNSVRVDGELF
jgi:hypothetical protein